VKKALAWVAAWWYAIPKPIRNFIDGGLAAAVGGATAAVLKLNINDPLLNAQTVTSVVVAGAVAAITAYARFKLADIWRTVFAPDVTGIPATSATPPTPPAPVVPPTPTPIAP
jgi:hypothetical protein